MVYILIAIATILAVWLAAKIVWPALTIDYDDVASDLDRDGAHDMLEKHLRHMALNLVLPGEFHSTSRDLEAAIAAMTRILEIEGESRDRDEVRDFVQKLARNRADEMAKDSDKHSIIFDDLWTP